MGSLISSICHWLLCSTPNVCSFSSSTQFTVVPNLLFLHFIHFIVLILPFCKCTFSSIIKEQSPCHHPTCFFPSWSSHHCTFHPHPLQLISITESTLFYLPNPMVLSCSPGCMPCPSAIIFQLSLFSSYLLTCHLMSLYLLFICLFVSPLFQAACSI